MPVWALIMGADKIITALLLSFLAGAMIAHHTGQATRLRFAREDAARLDRDGVIGWTQYNPETMQFDFKGRK